MTTAPTTFLNTDFKYPEEAKMPNGYNFNVKGKVLTILIFWFLVEKIEFLCFLEKR